MDYRDLTQFDIFIQEQLLEKCNEQIEKLPQQTMSYWQKNGKTYYYLTDNNKRRYLPPSSPLIGEIKLSHFAQVTAKIISHNLALQKRIIQSYLPYDYISVNTKLPKVYRLDAPPEVLSTDGTPAKTPLLAGDMDDVPYKERLIHRTSFGLAVRSKSEALIAEVLHAAGVVFAYELPLTLFDGDKAVFVRPDFTITARDGCRIYWEHLGMMSDAEYSKAAASKLRLYWQNGITVPDTLMLSMDSPGGAINVMAIRKLLEALSASHRLI